MRLAIEDLDKLRLDGKYNEALDLIEKWLSLRLSDSDFNQLSNEEVRVLLLIDNKESVRQALQISDFLLNQDIEQFLKYKVIYSRSRCFFRLGEIDKAEDIAQSLYNEVINGQNQESDEVLSILACCLNILGLCSSKKGELRDAKNQLQLSEAYFSKSGEVSNAAVVRNLLINVEDRLSIEYCIDNFKPLRRPLRDEDYQRIILDHKHEHNTYNLIHAHFNYGLYLVRDKQYKKASNNFHLYLELFFEQYYQLKDEKKVEFRDFHGSKFTTIIAYFIEQKDAQQALHLFELFRSERHENNLLPKIQSKMKQPRPKGTGYLVLEQV